MDTLRLIADTILFVFIPIILIAFVAGRLLGTRHSAGTSLFVALLGYLVGIAVAVGPDLDAAEDVSNLDVFEFALLATMLFLTALELLRGSGPRRQQGWIRWWRQAVRRMGALRR
ncbi:MAG: hypothetical protein ACK4V6_16010, partial [Microthrixaceae bacterium]